MQANHEKNVADAVDSLAHLQVGLDVNIKFTEGVRAMEFTKSLIVFDLFGIEMTHGWLVDPQATETMAAMKGKSYNQLMEKLIESKTAQTPQRKAAAPECEAAGGEAGAAPEGESEAGGPAMEEAAAPEEDEDYDEMVRTHSELLREGELIEAFTNENPSQLTYHGITELHSQLQDGQSVVFFRNNHYSVLHKTGGRLYNLVTDEGYAREADIVWELLCEVEGNCDFFNGRFTRFNPHQPAASPPAPPPASTSTIVQGVAVDPHYDADLVFAQKLQQQEEEAARRHQADQQRQSPPNPTQQQIATQRKRQADLAAAREGYILAAARAKAEKKKKDDSSCAVM